MEDFCNEEFSYFLRKFDQKYKKEKCIYDLKWPWKHPSDFHPQKDQTHCYQAAFFPLQNPKNPVVSC